MTQIQTQNFNADIHFLDQRNKKREDFQLELTGEAEWEIEERKVILKGLMTQKKVILKVTGDVEDPEANRIKFGSAYSFKKEELEVVLRCWDNIVTAT